MMTRRLREDILDYLSESLFEGASEKDLQDEIKEIFIDAQELCDKWRKDDEDFLAGRSGP